MSTTLAGLMEKSFDRFTPKRYLPEPPKCSIDYGNPEACPYCKAPMELSKVRKLTGELEPVYICRDHRAVGCVPDVQDTTKVGSSNVDENTTYKEAIPNG